LARHSTLLAMNLLALLIVAIVFRDINCYNVPNSVDPFKNPSLCTASTDANSNSTVAKIDSDHILVELENYLNAFIVAPADTDLSDALHANVTVLVDQLDVKGYECDAINRTFVEALNMFSNK
ncbi:hypothetical protein PFISCL1PPCAC_7301, partial [Pristionchus fissidentatus]